MPDDKRASNPEVPRKGNDLEKRYGKNPPAPKDQRPEPTPPPPPPPKQEKSGQSG